MPLISKFSKAITQLTTTGQSIWIDLGTHMPQSATFVLTWVNAGAGVVNFDYSDDASTVSAVSESTTALTDAGTVVQAFPISSSYRYVRINWTGGTATSLDATVEGNIIN